jgi:hypothetical protein
MTDPIITSEDAVLTPAETERLLGVSKFTLWRKRKLPDCGGLPFVRLSPGRIGYLRSDVRAFLGARRVGAPAEQERSEKASSTRPHEMHDSDENLYGLSDQDRGGEVATQGQLIAEPDPLKPASFATMEDGVRALDKFGQVRL